MPKYVLCDDILSYCLNLNNTSGIWPKISLNKIVKSPITKRHGLFTKFQDIIEEWFLFNACVLREELGNSSTKVETSLHASSKVPFYNYKFAYVQEDGNKKRERSSTKDAAMLASKFSVPLLLANQLNLLRISQKTKTFSDQLDTAYATCLGYDGGHFISGVVAKAYISKLQKA